MKHFGTVKESQAENQLAKNTSKITKKGLLHLIPVKKDLQNSTPVRLHQVKFQTNSQSIPFEHAV